MSERPDAGVALRRGHPDRSPRTPWLVRGSLLVLCLLLTAVNVPGTRETLVALALVALFVVASLASPPGRAGQLVLAGECLVWALLVLADGAQESAVLPYLLAPAFVGGYRYGLQQAVVVPGLAAGALLAGRALPFADRPLQQFTSSSAQWVLVAVAAGVVGAWLRRLLTAPRQDRREAPQEEAHRLLVQLRTVARRLPGSLDPATTAEHLLTELRAIVPVERGVVLVRGEAARGVPLAALGAQASEWELRLSSETAVADAWATQHAQVRDTQLQRADGSRPAGSSLVLPLTVGVRTLGLIAVETSTRAAYQQASTARALRQAQSVALTLDTALLFDEVRALATVEERRRLAREVHDGIAQELASLGYSLDDVVAQDDPSVARDLAQQTREEVRRLISELRMSLFDLRSAVDPQAGLGAALTEHVRGVGARTGLTVHLSLTESELRLPADTEAELLRIAQEAVANARKHSGADNLWVTCAVEPPEAFLAVEDDGKGLTRPADQDNYGIAIMQERARRLGAALEVSAREGGGTRVAVALGTLPHAVTTSPLSGQS